MAEISQTPTSQGNETLQKIKKIKRPIKRIVPGNPTGAPYQQQPGQMVNSPRVGQFNSPAENLDELLDNQLNLPATNNEMSARGNINNRQENSNTYQRPEHFLSEDDFEPRQGFFDSLMDGNLFTIKGVIIIAIIVFIFGILSAKLFGGSKTIVKDGLQGVIINAEVPRGRARCGIAEKTQGCVLYIMNPQRQDLHGRDFYDLASQLTGRQRFVVETGNMRYSSVKIRPGEFAQINIPPLQ